ncbi:MAG: PEP-CTERM sorting domain-containing protein [Gemmataceae bacterium]|nr:PEP-CTERM sorting domain-containing protein [Gemmataceae bacterium]
MRSFARGFGLGAAAVGLLLGTAARSQAALVFYADRASFNAANPGLPVEDFSEGVIGPDGVIGFDGPVSSTIPQGPFPLGLAVPGLTVDSQPPRGLFGSGLALTSPSFGGTANGNMIFANFFDDTLDLFFDPGVTAVAADLGSLFSDSNITVSVYGPGDVLLGSTVAAANNAGTGFFGVLSTMGDIARINLSSDTGQAEGVTNIAFGAGGAAVPEPASLASLAVAGLVGAGYRRLRRRA